MNNKPDVTSLQFQSVLSLSHSTIHLLQIVFRFRFSEKKKKNSVSLSTNHFKR